jgi:hypothetical protein
LKSDLDSKTVFLRKTILQSKFICKILYLKNIFIEIKTIFSIEKNCDK